jgi:predicted RNA-binding Zn-ribbon protein involved in translation (DUF1610 family)
MKELPDPDPSRESTVQDRDRKLQGLSNFPPRDKCMVAPRVVVTEHNYTIMCPKCGQEITKASYSEAYLAWWDMCL